jgi:hypothetical protein
MARRKKIDQSTIYKLVYTELDKLPERYVVCMDLRRSKGAANVNIGGTKFELRVKIFDSGVDDWTHAPNVASFTFEDSDGIFWWSETYAALVLKVVELCEKP